MSRHEQIEQDGIRVVRQNKAERFRRVAGVEQFIRGLQSDTHQAAQLWIIVNHDNFLHEFLPACVWISPPTGPFPMLARPPAPRAPFVPNWRVYMVSEGSDSFPPKRCLVRRSGLYNPRRKASEGIPLFQSPSSRFP